MLTVLYGNEPATVRTALQQDVLATAPPETDIIYIEADAFVPGQLAEVVHGTSLFATTYIYVLDTPSDNTAYQAEFAAQLEALAESVHHFIVLEKQLKAPEKKKLSKHADTVTDYSVTKPKRPDAFTMAARLCERNKRGLWLELQTARANQLRPEEIIGTLWWQLKTLRLAATTNSAEEAGMKSYPYQKAKQALGTYSQSEIETLSRKLLAVYHDGHTGVRDIDLALEEWVLTV